MRAALKAGEKTLKYYRTELDVTKKADDSPLTCADLESNKAINECLAVSEIPILSEENDTISWTTRKKWNTYWLIDPLDGTKEFIHKRDEFTINIALIENNSPVLGVVYAPALNLLYYGMEEKGSFKAAASAGYTVEEVKKCSVPIFVGFSFERLRIITSRSHFSTETNLFIDGLKKYAPVEKLNSMGSSLKLCMVAEGSADIYPRYGPTMEWDTAAGHAVVVNAGGTIIELTEFHTLLYNKKDLHNPHFIVYNPEIDPIIRKLINIG